MISERIQNTIREREENELRKKAEAAAEAARKAEEEKMKAEEARLQAEREAALRAESAMRKVPLLGSMVSLGSKLSHQVGASIGSIFSNGEGEQRQRTGLLGKLFGNQAASRTPSRNASRSNQYLAQGDALPFPGLHSVLTVSVGKHENGRSRTSSLVKPPSRSRTSSHVKPLEPMLIKNPNESLHPK